MTMQRFATRLATARCYPASQSAATRLTVPISSRLQKPYGTSSSPKSAEDASAQSGGSRSKEAAQTGSSPTGGILGDGKNIPDMDKSESDSSSGGGGGGGGGPTEGVVPDELANGSMKGRTGGGEPLNSSQDAPKKPLVDSHSLPGGDAKLTKEQQAEVDQHNKEFEAKHGRGEPAKKDEVDPKFWSSKGKEAGTAGKM
ncbi:hypothetical protein V8F06_006081 [Rhypophila decipiens]